LLFGQDRFLVEIGLQLVRSNDFSQFSNRQAASISLEISSDHSRWSLGNEAEEVELCKGDRAFRLDTGNLHDFVNLLVEFFEVLSVVHWLIEVVWSEGLVEVLVAHDVFAILILHSGELLEDLLRSSEKSDFVQLCSYVMVFL